MQTRKLKGGPAGTLAQSPNGNPLRQASRELLYALDPVQWSADTLGFNADPWQASFLNSSSKRSILLCCRQAGKSTTTAVKSTHKAIFNPGSLILPISRSHRQSILLFEKCAANLDTAKIKLTTSNQTSCTLANGSKIVSLPGDDPDLLRGFSAVSLLLFDEAAVCLDAVYYACRPMLAVSGGSLTLLGTPKGKRGFMYSAYTSTAEEWERTEVTADQCPRIEPSFLAAERAVLGEWLYRQEYNCEFVQDVSQLYSEESISRAFDRIPDPLFPNFGDLETHEAEYTDPLARYAPIIEHRGAVEEMAQRRPSQAGNVLRRG